MAIDARLLLAGVVPDVADSAAKGFALGQGIRNAPILRQMQQQRLAQGEQGLAQGEQTAAQNEMKLGRASAQAINSVIGDSTAEQITPDVFAQSTRALTDLGVPLDDDDLTFSPENVANLLKISAAGKQLNLQGKGRPASAQAFAPKTVRVKTGVDDAGNDVFELQQVSAIFDPSRPQGERLTQSSVALGGDLVSSTTGETVTQKRTGDLQQAGDIAKTTVIKKTEGESEVSAVAAATAAEKADAIAEIQASTASEIEKNKKIGVLRGQIETDIKTNAIGANRSRGNLQRIKRGLSMVKTGRMAAAQDLLGGLIPGIRDADSEVFLSMASQFALDELARQGGTKTDFDFKKAAETQARLGNTQEANEVIINIAFDRIDEIEDERRQFGKFVKGGGNAEDFEFKSVPIEHVQFIRAHSDNAQAKKDFKAKYGYLPTGL